jgi:hypothetical protein
VLPLGGGTTNDGIVGDENSWMLRTNASVIGPTEPLAAVTRKAHNRSRGLQMRDVTFR